ncbi:MAG: DUF6516 family protein [Mesorhizobium sp.]|nr:DUF6516 family protein [Mesorhizobium sp.]
MAKATLILNEKRELPNGAISEIRIWRLPSPTAERPHGLKYSLFYGRPGERIIGYDNEAGKGDHRHYRDVELPYFFTTLPRLISDFRRDMERELAHGRNTHPG